MHLVSACQFCACIVVNGSKIFPYPVFFLSPPKLISTFVKYLKSIMSARHDEITLELIDYTSFVNIIVMHPHSSRARFPLIHLSCVSFNITLYKFNRNRLKKKGYKPRDGAAKNTNRRRVSRDIKYRAAHYMQQRAACNQLATWERVDRATCTCIAA